MARYSGQLQSKLKNYQELGYKAGGKGLPPTTASAMDEHETKLHAEAQRCALDEHSHFKQVEVGKTKTLADIEHALGELETNSETLLNEGELSEVADHAMAQERLQLIKYRKDQLEREADLKAFRALNGITQQADYPPDRLWTFAWLFVVIVVETAINAVFYENANGLIGGAVVALGVSFVNLGAAWALGHGFCYKNLRATGWRTFGWACVLVAVLLAIYLNAVFATFRAEYQLVTDPTDFGETGAAFRKAIEAAGQVFWLHFPASDFMSFVLFFIGLLLSGFAFYKGYTFDDTYPGHGRLDRLYKEAEARYETLSLMAKEKVRAEIEKKRSQVAALRTQLQQTSSQLGQVRGAISSAHTDMRTALKQIQGEFALVLKTYRDCNTAVRPVPPPDYFADTPDVVGRYLEDEGDALHAKLDALEQKLHELRDQYGQRLTDRLSQLTGQGQDLLGRVFAEYLGSVTQEAQAHINKEKMIMPMQTGYGYEKQ